MSEQWQICKSYQIKNDDEQLEFFEKKILMRTCHKSELVLVARINDFCVILENTIDPIKNCLSISTMKNSIQK